MTNRALTIYGADISQLYQFIRDFVGEGKQYPSREEAAFRYITLAQEYLTEGRWLPEVSQTLNIAKFLLKGGDRRNANRDPRVDPIAVDRRQG